MVLWPMMIFKQTHIYICNQYLYPSIIGTKVTSYDRNVNLLSSSMFHYTYSAGSLDVSDYHSFNKINMLHL